MISHTLSLRCTAHRQRPTQALLLPWAEPAAWVEEVTRWEVNQMSLRFHPLPAWARDLTTAAVLVTTEQSHQFAPAMEKVHGRCIAYGCLSGRLYLPVEAEFGPAVAEQELEKLLNDRYRYVWQPAVGLVAFEPEDTLSLADLLASPSFAAADWSQAQTGTRFSRKIISLQAAWSDSLDSILDQGREDIGSDGDQWNELGKSPEEPATDPLSKAGQKGKSLLAGMAGSFGSLAGKLAGQGPAGAAGGGSNWYQRMQQWANEQRQKIDSALQAERNKEVLRLLHLMESNPDEGLRYALPLDSAAPRGMAPPSNRLGQRDVNFSLSGLGGGGGADYWAMDNQYRQRLIQQYHAAANRELKLGRYRRAAYIYAQLLGDFNAAASALAEGGHHREAAVLYRDKLGRPEQAAKCLADGGLWTEAIELYDELQKYVEVGDLYRKLEQETEAVAAYQQAIGQLRARSDYLAASGVYTDKLHDIDGAVRNLSDAWPHSRQAAGCVREIIAINARQGRHESTRQWIDRLRSGEAAGNLRITAVEIAADTAASYPDAEVTHHAADTTRVLVAGLLPVLDRGRLVGVMDSLRKLAPHDRLLASDTRRYVDRWEPPRRPTPAIVKPQPWGKVRLVRIIGLNKPSQDVTWLAAAWSDSTIYAAGFQEQRKRLVLARANWLGASETQSPPWKMSSYDSDSLSGRLLLSAQPYHDHFAFLQVVDNEEPLPQWEVRRSDLFPHILRMGGAVGVQGRVRGAYRTSHNRTWIVEQEIDLLRLVAVNSEGKRLTALPLNQSPHETYLLDSPMLPMHAWGDLVYVALGNELVTFNAGKQQSVLPYQEQMICSLAGSAPNTLQRLALGFALGGEIIWPSMAGDPDESERRIRFGESLASPRLGINRGGYLIAADEGGKAVEIYRTHGRELAPVGELESLGARPLAILSPPEAKRFGIALDNGSVNVYEVD